MAVDQRGADAVRRLLELVFVALLAAAALAADEPARMPSMECEP